MASVHSTPLACGGRLVGAGQRAARFAGLISGAVRRRGQACTRVASDSPPRPEVDSRLTTPRPGTSGSVVAAIHARIKVGDPHRAERVSRWVSEISSTCAGSAAGEQHISLHRRLDRAIDLARCGTRAYSSSDERPGFDLTTNRRRSFDLRFAESMRPCLVRN